MIVTGNDSISIEILEELNNKSIKVKEIPGRFDVSLDQAKRLSRFSKMIAAVEENVPDRLDKLNQLGLKSLALAELFKKKDYEGIEEILSCSDRDTSRENLKELIVALQDKREEVEAVRIDIEKKVEKLEKEKKRYIHLIDVYKKDKKKLDDIKAKFDVYKDDVRRFLVNHLAIDREGAYILQKRLHEAFMSKLNEMKILTRNTYEIVNLNLLVEEYEIREEEDLAIELEQGSSESIYLTESHRIKALNEDTEKNIKEAKDRLQKTEKKIQSEMNEIKTVQQRPVSAFLKRVEVPAALSKSEARKHQELKVKIAKWLYSKKYAVDIDFKLQNEKRVDVIATNSDREVVIVQIKVSQSESDDDRSWKDCLEFCDEFYFYTDADIQLDLDKRKTGVISKNKSSFEVTRKDDLDLFCHSRDNIAFDIARSASQKNIFNL